MRFATAIRKAFDNEYVKVFIDDESTIELVKHKLEQVKSIKRINITPSNNGGESSQTLTVYPKPMYTAKDVVSDINKCLSIVKIETPQIKQKRVNETLNKLDICPEAKKLYEQALEKKDRYERNALDDMRLCLELYLKKTLDNAKSLENQKNDIGRYQQNKGSSVEFTNMFGKLIDYYTKYQNEHIKHNDAVNQKDVDFIIKLTTDFIDSF